MSYQQFERLLLVLGGVAILATSLVAAPPNAPWQEFVGQLLLFGVLAAALHWGRRGGFIAAAVASLLYVGLRLPLITSAEVTGATIAMLLSRIVAFGLVGIVGGEAFSRIKYAFARFEGQDIVDDWSRVFNQRFAAGAITAALARHRRYGEPFSIVCVSLSSALTSALSPRKQRSIIRGVANHIRNDVRMVDEVARLDDGRFVVLLPHTPGAGARVVAERMGAGVRSALGARDESVAVMVLDAEDDFAQLESLAAELSAPYSEEAGEYSSEGESTRYPADRRTSSADASVLNTSVAEPDPASKQ